MTAIMVQYCFNQVYSSVDGVLFDKSQAAMLIQCPGGKSGGYTISDGVTNIMSAAFYGCSILTNIIIPDGITSIGSDTFNRCSSLTSVIHPQQRHQHWKLCVLFLHQLDQRNNSRQRHQHWNRGVFRVLSAWPNQRLFLWAMPHTSRGSMIHSLLHFGDCLLLCRGLRAGIQCLCQHAAFRLLLWLPQVQTGGGNLGVRTNQFGFNINWASGRTVVVEACTNLASPTWFPVSTNTLTSSTSHFSDPAWRNYPGRFYRLRSL